jgi:hypothetical protein
MAEPEASSISGGRTPEPPLEPSEIAAKVKADTEDRPIKEKAHKAASELDREVSGEYEAKQEKEAGEGTPRPVKPKSAS